MLSFTVREEMFCETACTFCMLVCNLIAHYVSSLDMTLGSHMFAANLIALL